MMCLRSQSESTGHEEVSSAALNMNSACENGEEERSKDLRKGRYLSLSGSKQNRPYQSSRWSVLMLGPQHLHLGGAASHGLFNKFENRSNDHWL